MDQGKVAQLLQEALDEIDGDTTAIDRLTDAIERLIVAINAQPYWVQPYKQYVTWTTDPAGGTTGGTTLRT